MIPGKLSCVLLLALSASSDAFTSPSQLPAFATKSNNVSQMKQFTTSSKPTSHVSMMIDPSVMDIFSSTSVSALADAAPDAVPSSGEVTYSNVSYYTTLGVYVLSFPGLWSQIKRSTSAKIKRKTYVSPGEAAGGKDQRQQAGEIMAYMKANNYEVQEAGEVITFRGLVARSTSQAFFLTFCTALGLASLALVLQIQLQNLSLPIIGVPNYFLLVLLSPYAGIYYWRSGDRVDDIKVKLQASDDETENEVVIEGNDEELDRLWRALELTEKGMVKVEGILDSA